LGVKNVVVPRKGKLSKARRSTEGSRSFCNIVEWRTGCEGRAAAMKRGWARTLMDGTVGASTWCGWGVFAHKAVKVALLASQQQVNAAPPPRRSPPRPRAAGPPVPAPPLHAAPPGSLTT